MSSDCRIVPGVAAMSVSFTPVGNWFVVAAFAVVVTGLTLWAYWPKLKTSTGAWRWFALGLRLAAVLLCVVAALRPSVVFKEKKKQPATLDHPVRRLDEHDHRRRGERPDALGPRAQDARRRPARSPRRLGEGLTVKFYRFDKGLRDDPADDNDRARRARRRRYGQAILDSVQRERDARRGVVVLLGDGANNAGPAPLPVASRLRSQDVPSTTVGFGDRDARARSRETSPSGTSSPARPCSSRTTSRSRGRWSPGGSRTSGSTWRCSSRGSPSPWRTQTDQGPRVGRGRSRSRAWRTGPRHAGREADHGPREAEGGGTRPGEQHVQHVRHRPEGGP